MENLSNISVIRDVLTRHGFSFSKGLGQNFLINPTVCPRMAESGNAQPGWGMIEIGAGVGVLTAELARRANKVVCIEIDSRLLPILDETLAEFDNIKIVNEDVLKVDLHKLIREEFAGMPVAVCANLPYYITSPIIMSLLEARLPIVSLTVMVQKEAAQRLCAAPGSREVGAVSIAVQYYSQPQVLFQVPRGLLYAVAGRRFDGHPSGCPPSSRRCSSKRRRIFSGWSRQPFRSAEKPCPTPSVRDLPSPSSRRSTCSSGLGSPPICAPSSCRCSSLPILLTPYNKNPQSRKRSVGFYLHYRKNTGDLSGFWKFSRHQATVF